ncbi:MAG: hypothetical protein CM15mP73_5150 [Hyphomicrobiales bacterium]|nr:MAG: hypothetical protein CM15mP73_5150 [Hyphomicrobiales bacterium]
MAYKFQKLNIKPQDGMEVIASGKITTYSRGSNSKYQIMIDNIEVAVKGAIGLYEKLKKVCKRRDYLMFRRKKFKFPKKSKNLLF